MMSSMHPLLAGTLPVRPFHPDGFFGTIQVDGQQPKVAALACDELDLVILSLVGYDTSVSAAFASLWKKEALTFHLGEGVEWHGPHHLSRRKEGYKQFSNALAGTREVHCVALPVTTHIAEGILHPPDMPKPEEEQQHDKHKVASAPITVDRFVLGNWDEETPNERSFLGQLYAVRVILLHRELHHPEWVALWANELWSRGLTRKLIVPVKALGIKAWKITGSTATWNLLIHDGVREGWLPWRKEERMPSI